MTLQNALGNLALDATLAQLITAVQALTAVAQAQQAAADTAAAQAQHDARMFPPRALQYARDPSDRMYVNVGAAPTTVVTPTLGTTAGAPPVWYATQGSPNSIDAREVQREMSQQTFNDVRRARWVFT